MRVLSRCTLCLPPVSFNIALSLKSDKRDNESISVDMKRIELIAFLRGISIFTIVLMHLCMGLIEGVLHKALAFGGAGVHEFVLCLGLGCRYCIYPNTCDNCCLCCSLWL